MSKTIICDVCGARSPDLKIKAYAKQWLSDGWGGGWDMAYDLCELCWAAFKVWVTSNPRKENNDSRHQ